MKYKFHSIDMIIKDLNHILLYKSIITSNLNRQCPKKKKRIRGFAGVIASQLEPVNNKKRFKEKFKDYEDFRLVINASDARYAAIVIIDKGVLSVEGVRNSDKAVIKKLKKESEGYLEMTIDLFFKMAMGELSTAAQAKYWLTRKIKVKGMKNVNILNKLFYYLTDEVK